MPKVNSEYLNHIIDECDYIISLNINDENFDDFMMDETLKRAVVRSIEIIGEASKKLSNDFREDNDYINWKNLAGMRDKLIDDYFGINYIIVWDVINNKIPDLRNQIEKIIK